MGCWGTLLMQSESGNGFDFSSHALLQGIFPTQGSNPHLQCLLHCRQILCCWATKEAYYLCEKYYKPITVQYDIADCFTWVPRLTLLEATNKLELWTHSRSRTHSDVEGLLYSDLFKHCTDQTRPTCRPAVKQACLSTGQGRRENFHAPSDQGRGQGQGEWHFQEKPEVLMLCWAKDGLYGSFPGYHPAERRKRPDGKSSFVHAYQLLLQSGPHYNVPGHLLKYIKYRLWQCWYKQIWSRLNYIWGFSFWF